MSTQAARPVLRTGRWQLPSGRATGRHARRAIRRTLRKWDVGPAAGDLTDHLTALVQEFLARTSVRGHGPIDLRLELRASARLLLGEIHVPPAAGDPALARTGCREFIALTYGRRLTRDGATRYIHAFTWRRPDAITADH